MGPLCGPHLLFKMHSCFSLFYPILSFLKKIVGTHFRHVTCSTHTWIVAPRFACHYTPHKSLAHTHTGRARNQGKLLCSFTTNWFWRMWTCGWRFAFGKSSISLLVYIVHLKKLVINKFCKIQILQDPNVQRLTSLDLIHIQHGLGFLNKLTSALRSIQRLAPITSFSVRALFLPQHVLDLLYFFPSSDLCKAK